MQSTIYNRISVIIVSGFLGAGKTTFIQKLVAPSLNRERTVILENEFGDVDFDGALLKKSGLSVVSVLAGCICCTGIGDFTGAIQEVAEDFSPQLIVIEPTGVAKLSEVLMQFRLPPLSGICAVRQAITVVDAKNFDKRHFISEEFYDNQLINSDVAILSKTDGLDQDKIDHVVGRIHEIAPCSLIIDRPWDQLSDDERETCRNYRKTQDHACHEHHEHDEHKHHDHHGHGHSHAFAAYSCYPTCSAEYLRENSRELSGGRFGNVLRVKGFLRSVDGAWMQIDYVPDELRITDALGMSQEEAPHLVFIGSGLKEQTIAEFLESYSDCPK